MMSLFSWRQQQGQALAESVIGLSFAIIPLLLLVPLMGKIAGVQHRAIEAAQYSAWERTVWRVSAPPNNSSGNGANVAIRAQTRIAQDLPQRFYAKDGQILTSEQPSNSEPWNWDRDSHPLLQAQWQQDNDNSSLFKNPNQQQSANSNSSPRLLTNESAGKVPGTANSIVSGALSLLNMTGFTLKQDQYYRTNVSSPLVRYYMAPFDEIDIVPHGSAALLASGWNANGGRHVRKQVSELVPLRLFDNSAIEVLQIGAGFIAQELDPSSLKFGHIDENALPANKLCTYGTANCGEQ
ncbi:hypothetical protein [Shewanella sp.]|uniref:hypothetical protein n=1 Tax=Shewanella sp. TaxID=50422 RepID=UPI003A980F58